MERPLADGEARLGADPGQPGFELLDAVPMSLRELGRRRPLLSVMADVLALVLADRTAVGRCGGRGVLRAAGDADEGGHAGKCACGSFSAAAAHDAWRRRHGRELVRDETEKQPRVGL